MTFTDAIAELLFGAQSRLVTAFEDYDGKAAFRREPWERRDFGRGRVCVLEGGRTFERAGVNVSSVRGAAVPSSIAAGMPELAGRPYRATGISMVLHPLNPYAPSFHANLRYFEVGETWWFGGGMDLTPMYGFAEDAAHFHRTLRDWCGRHERADYPAWKAACDEYFIIPHRREMRGVGGVFFDHLADGGFAEYRELLADGIETVPVRVPADRRPAPGPALRRAGATVAAGAPRTVRRVQPRPRPGHAVRPADRREHRGDPHLDAAGGRLVLRRAAARRLTRGRGGGVPAAA